MNRAWIGDSTFLFLIAAKGLKLNVMMKASVDAGLLFGYKVGDSTGLQIFHLQFANDTLLIGEKRWTNIRSLEVVLTWRLLHSRIHTPYNLLQRGLLQNQHQLCVGGCGLMRIFVICFCIVFTLDQFGL